MILGGYSTGLRLGDLATMPWGAVDLESGTVNVLTQKTGKQVRISIVGPFKDLLASIRPANPKPLDSIWPVEAKRYEQFRAAPFSTEFYEILLACGLASPRTHKATGKGRDAKREFTGFSFHCLRHTFVSTLKSTGATSEVAKALVGHSSDEINQVYTHLPEKLLSDAVALLPDITTQQSEPTK
jgi:integrase